MIRLAKGLAAGEEAATMIEYALIITLIALSVLVAVNQLRSSISSFYTSFNGRVGGS